MDSTTGIILAISLILIMFGMGLSLTLTDFKRVFVFPKAIIIGLCCQIIFLPLIGYALATALQLSPTIAIGLMLLAACPGGPTSNMLTFLAKGDLALSVSLTAVASVLTIFTIPLIVQFAVQEFSNESQTISVDAFTMIKQLTMISGTYGPNCLLIWYMYAAKKRSAMVTNVAIVSVNTRIRKCGLRKPRIRLTITLAPISTAAVAAAIVMAGFMPLVTAKTGHIPSNCR